VNYEVEQKFRLADAAALEGRLATMNAPLGPAVAQVDRYFAHPGRDFAATDEALRIRSVGEMNWVTYKGPKIDAATKTRRELELPIEAGKTGAERFGELLEALGFRPVTAVRKQRRKAIVRWHDRECEVVLDDVEGVGQFCEIEFSADESELATARQALATLARELALSEVERRSYLEMLLGR